MNFVFEKSLSAAAVGFVCLWASQKIKIIGTALRKKKT